MKLIDRRIAKLEKTFAPLADRETDWGWLGNCRDELLRRAELLGEQTAAEIKEELDKLGPWGFWRETARCYLREHGFVQSGGESFAETIARALGFSIDELKACMAEGRLG